MPKLIFIRGPAAVGKSTVANTLMKKATRATVLIDLDRYRFSFVNPPVRDHDLEYEMSTGDILIALDKGFDVIFDGNFSARADDPFLKRLFDAHPNENYLFYLDSSLQETLRRHGTKVNPLISAEQMKEVYNYASPTGHETEVVIPEQSTLEQTVQQIKRVAGI